MNMQQVVQPRSPSNGYGRRKAEKDSAARSESKFQTGKANYGRTNSGNHYIILMSIQHVFTTVF